MKKRSRFAIGIVTICALTYTGNIYWQYLSTHPSTDNAYVNANKIEINANISGQIKTIAVQDNQLVKKNQLLFQIDPRPMEIALQKAKANLALTQLKIRAAKDAVEVAQANIVQAQAQFDLDAKNARRITSLVNSGKLAMSEGDKVKTQLLVSKASLAASKSQYQKALMALGAEGDQNAQLQQAKAQLADAELQLAYTKITAPASGKITHFTSRPGDMVQRGQTIFTLIEQQQWWIDANYKETQLERIKVGQQATVLLDMYPEHPIEGTVESISSGTGSAFSILPTENAAGNWVKVTQRIPVRIAIKNDKNYPLPIGASAYVTIDSSDK